MCVDVNTIWTGDRTVSTLALDNRQKFNSFLEFWLSNFWEHHIRAPELRLEIQSMILRAEVLFTQSTRMFLFNHTQRVCDLFSPKGVRDFQFLKKDKIWTSANVVKYDAPCVPGYIPVQPVLAHKLRGPRDRTVDVSAPLCYCRVGLSERKMLLSA